MEGSPNPCIRFPFFVAGDKRQGSISQVGDLWLAKEHDRGLLYQCTTPSCMN